LLHLHASTVTARPSFFQHELLVEATPLLLLLLLPLAAGVHLSNKRERVRAEQLKVSSSKWRNGLPFLLPVVHDDLFYLLTGSIFLSSSSSNTCTFALVRKTLVRLTDAILSLPFLLGCQTATERKSFSGAAAAAAAAALEVNGERRARNMHGPA
jgi:hypothetical protein